MPNDAEKQILALKSGNRKAQKKKQEDEYDKYSEPLIKPIDRTDELCDRCGVRYKEIGNRFLCHKCWKGTGEEETDEDEYLNLHC